MAVPGVKQVSSGWGLQGGSTSGGVRINGGSAKRKSNVAAVLQPAWTGSAAYLQPAAEANYYQNSGYSAPSGGGGGGGDGGGGDTPYVAPAPPPDPYARWGGYEGFKAAENNYNQTKNLTYGSITDAIGDTVTGTKSSVLDFLTGYGQQQKGIDKQSMRSELTRETKRLGILDMIGQGLRNGQVTLNNSNASSSSAGEQIAKAYGRQGQKQMVAANLGYNLEQEDVQDAQEALGISLETFKRKYGEDKGMAANKIVQTAVSALSSLDQLALTGGVGGRIDVEAEKTRIRNQAMTELNAIDTIFNEGVAKVKPSSRATNRAEAFKLMNSGYVPENALGFDSTLPIYTLGA